MANKYQVVDEVLRQQGVEGTYNVTFTNLNITDTENTESVEVVGAISDKVKENLKYSDLNEAPGIPEEGYEEVNEQEVVKDFHKVAFTGDYDHLENAPQIPAGIDRTNGVTFNEIAFTGNIDLNNVQVSNVINFYGADAQPPSSNQLRITPPSDETNRLITDNQIATFNTVLSFFGRNNAYVLGFNPPGGSPLATAITSFYSKFKNTQLPSFFITKAGIFFVLNAIQPSTTSIDYIQFDLAQVDTINYDNTIRDNLAALFTTPISLDENGTNENAQEILNNITFTSKRVSFIFDFIKQIIICKVQENTEENIEQNTGINVEDIDVTELQGLADVAISGSYTDLIDAPNIPNEGIEIVNNEPIIKPFQAITFTGNYDDLNNRYYLINFSNFKYKRNSENENIFLTQNEFDILSEIGILKGYIKDIDQLYNSTTEYSSNTQLISVLEDELLDNFINKQKICYLSTRGVINLITKIDTFYINNAIAFISIIGSPIIDNNYGSQLSNISINSNSDIENILNQITALNVMTPCITIDFNKKILYSYSIKYKIDSE